MGVGLRRMEAILINFSLKDFIKFIRTLCSRSRINKIITINFKSSLCLPILQAKCIQYTCKPPQRLTYRNPADWDCRAELLSTTGRFGPCTEKQNKTSFIVFSLQPKTKIVYRNKWNNAQVIFIISKGPLQTQHDL